MIQVKELKKTYGSITAVDGISFDIHKGESFGLLGPNGAGKTTTIHMLIGLIKPDSGTITINGASDPTIPEVRKQLGTTPQSLALYDTLTGWENLIFFGKLQGVHGTLLKEKANWALELTGLTERKNYRVQTYSGGMKRRLNLACSLLHDPLVLLMDEPTVGVDPQSRNLLFDNIEKLKSEGKTILYTTHYMEEAERLCDRVAIMDHGKILAWDTVPNLITNYGGKSFVEAEFESLPARRDIISGEWEGNKLKMATDRPLQLMAQLANLGVSLKTLHVDKPTLEAVFLNLTGRKLRDL